MTFFDFLYILFRGGDEMVVVYATLIIAGAKTYAQVPAKLQAQVKEHLKAMGLDENGDPIVEEDTPVAE